MLENAVCTAAVGVICAFAVTFFAIANRTGVQSADIAQSNAVCISAVERFKAGETLATEVFYDKNWRVTDGDHAVFRLFSETKSTGQGSAAVLSFSRYYGEESDIIYDRSTMYYVFSVTVERISDGSVLAQFDAVKYDKYAAEQR